MKKTEKTNREKAMDVINIAFIAFIVSAVVFSFMFWGVEQDLKKEFAPKSITDQLMVDADWSRECVKEVENLYWAYESYDINIELDEDCNDQKGKVAERFASVYNVTKDEVKVFIHRGYRLCDDYQKCKKVADGLYECGDVELCENFHCEFDVEYLTVNPDEPTRCDKWLWTENG